jgi:hypothetical protein
MARKPDFREITPPQSRATSHVAAAAPLQAYAVDQTGLQPLRAGLMSSSSCLLDGSESHIHHLIAKSSFACLAR